MIGFSAGAFLVVDVAVDPRAAPFFSTGWPKVSTPTGRTPNAEMHIYRRGKDGFGMVKQGFPSDRWIEQFQDWLTDLGFA